MRNIFYTLLLSVALMACTSENRPVVQAGQTWNLDVEHADTLLRHAVDSIRFLALESGEDSELYGIDKLIVKNGLVYLADFRAGKIVAYDESGRSRFVLDAKGEGPEEYLEMRSFAADDSCIYTLDNYRHSLNVYGCRDGRYRKSLKLPFVAWDMEVLPDGSFIFAYSPGRGGKPSMNQGRYRIFITDRDLKIEKRLLPMKRRHSISLTARLIFRLPVRVCCLPRLRPTTSLYFRGRIRSEESPSVSATGFPTATDRISRG